MVRRELLDRERGTVLKKWTNRVAVCVAFPNTYYIGMSNLAVHLLYRALNSRPEIVCERVFLDAGGKSLSVESGRPLSSFEIVFFTLSFEMDYPNIVAMLQGSAIPLAARERGAKGPLIVGGGICAMANPEPISPFFDLFIMGDVESCIPPFIEGYLASRGKTRTGVIEELSAWSWVYNPARLDVDYRDDGTVDRFAPPSFHVGIERYKGRGLATSAIVTDSTEFADMLLVEGTRGCPSRCAFCLAGNIYPFISDRLDQVGDDVKEVGIIGGGVSFHPRLPDIIRRFREMGVRVHLPSLRLDEVPLEVIDMIKETIKTLTFGIEAGTEELRGRIGKPLTDADIAGRVEAIADMKSFNFKFYFMVGLPGERREDVDAIVELVKHILHLLVKKGSKKGRIGTVTVHASPFVPKAATPFQWLAMDEMRELKEKIAILKRGLGKVANTQFTHESVKYSFLQGVFARGDRRLKDVIERLAKGETFARIARESPINLNFYATRERRKDELFPWDFIGGETEKETLRRRLRSCLGDGLPDGRTM
ncbi:MAG: radical SAM protein [Syntrophorhabdales bacterium]|jgi:radical SAM superfamily enzyme YgiQ (UPF0313 family)